MKDIPLFFSFILLEYSDCSASENQNDYNCSEAIDGKTNEYDNGWAASSPAYAIFELTNKRTMNTLVMMSGRLRNDHKLIVFRVTLKVDEQWINLTGLKVQEDPSAEIGGDGTITLASGIEVLQLEFNTVSYVQSIRLDVTKTDNLNNNVVVNEIIPKFEHRGSKL